MLQLLNDSLLFGLAVAFIGIGILGTLLPVLPGPLLILATLLLYGFVDRFEAPGPWLTALLSLLLLFAMLLEIWLPAATAQRYGAPRRAIVLGMVGGIVGLFFGLVLGSIVGYALGVLIGCYQKYGDWSIAWKASIGSLTGQGLAALLQFGIGLIVLAAFILSVLTAS